MFAGARASLDALPPVREGPLFLTLGFEVWELVGKWLVFTLGVSRTFVSQIFHQKEGLSPLPSLGLVSQPLKPG